MADPYEKETGAVALAHGQRGEGQTSPLRQRPFVLYVAGQLLSQLGDGIYLVALPFVVLSHGGPARLGVVLTCYGVARLAVLPLGGTLADRRGARRVMLATDAARAGVVLGYVPIGLLHAVPLWALLAVSVPFGLLDGVFRPASLAVLPDIVPPASLAAANSLNSTLQSTGQIAGPAVGGVLVGGLKSGTGMLADAITFAVSSVTLFAIGIRRGASQAISVAETPWTRRAEEAAAVPRPSAGADVAEGPPGWRPVLAYAWHSPVLRMSLIVTFVVNLTLGGLVDVVLPPFSVAPLGAGARGFGIMVAGIGLGSVAGSLAGAPLMRLKRRGVLAVWLGMAEGALVICVPTGNSLAIATAALFLVAVIQGMLNVLYVTTLQRDAPAGALGRVMSLLIACAFVAYPVSTGVFGALIGVAGPTELIRVAGLCLIAAFSIGFTSRAYREI